MNTKSFNTLVAVLALLLMTTTGLQAQSLTYSNAVVSLDPAGYWPMHEQAVPAVADVETNYGSLGALGTAYWADWSENNGAPGNSEVLHQIPGALANGSDGGAWMVKTSTNTSYLLVPHTSPLTTLRPPFTVEFWVKGSNYNFGDIVSQDGTILNGGNGDNKYGARITWGGRAQLYVGGGFPGLNGPVLSTNQWHYEVVTCNNAGGTTNWTMYIDGTEAASVSSSGFRPDSWDPLTIGAGMWNNVGVTRSGAYGIDEVAVYTNVLSPAEISSHWSVATNVLASASAYYNAVISDNPLLYYRMDSPSFQGWQPTNTWPVLHNYGSAAFNGVYMPGVRPGSVAGPNFYGLSDTNAMPGNGLSAFADAGFSPALNPTNHMPFSVTVCFKGNPADSRYQNIVGHSDNSWRIALDPTGHVHFNVIPGGGSDAISAGVFNDGNWHQVVGVYDGTSNYIYVDGVLDGQSLVGTNSIPGSTDDALLGADPQYLTGNTGAGRQFAGDLCEVACFTNALSESQVRSLYNAIEAPVTSVSGPVLSRVGASDVFSVSANGSSPVYQWYFNTVSNYSGATPLTDNGAVSGATTPSVTITNLTAYYFAVVANNWGGVTSSIAQVSQSLTTLSAGKPIWNPVSQTNIIVSFSDTLNPATATNVNNYTLDNSASVLSAALGEPNEVVLTTSPLNASTAYTLTIQNVENYYGVTQTPSATNLVVGVYPENLALWVRADTGVTTNASGAVTQWNDMSGNGNNLLPGTDLGFTDPLLTNSASGQPTIYFNATNGTYGSALYANDASSLHLTGNMSVIAVVNFTVSGFGGNRGEIVSKTGSYHANIPAPFDFYGTHAGSHLYRGNGTSYGQFGAGVYVPTNTPQILAVSETGNTVSDFLNGKAVGSGILNRSFDVTNCADQGQPLVVGGRMDFAYHHLTGYLSELIVAGSAITPYDLGRLDSYLITRHHLVSVNTNPTNIVVSAASGNRITLSWPMDHTGWQLQSNSVGLAATGAWVNVSGSTVTNQMTITPDVTKTNVFYRLIYQKP